MPYFAISETIAPILTAGALSASISSAIFDSVGCICLADLRVTQCVYSINSAFSLHRMHLEPHNAAPEWLAGSLKHLQRSRRGLTTPGACYTALRGKAIALLTNLPGSEVLIFKCGSHLLRCVSSKRVVKTCACYAADNWDKLRRLL